MTFNLKSVTVTENTILAIASDKDNNEKEFMYAHSLLGKKILDDEFQLMMELQKRINR